MLQSFLSCKYCLLSGRHYLFPRISIYVIRLGICKKNMLTCLMTKMPSRYLFILRLKSCAFDVHINTVTFIGKYKLTICVEHTFPQCYTFQYTCSFQWDPKNSNRVRDETQTSAMQSMYRLWPQWIHFQFVSLKLGSVLRIPKVAGLSLEGDWRDVVSFLPIWNSGRGHFPIDLYSIAKLALSNLVLMISPIYLQNISIFPEALREPWLVGFTLTHSHLSLTELHFYTKSHR